jgi:deoxyribodipyrimidine photo-lyase
MHLRIFTKTSDPVKDEIGPEVVFGGRTRGLAQLKLAVYRNAQAHYADRRDDFTYETTHLSAYLKFGCISVREAYHTFREQYGLKHELIRQLIWREFFAHILAAHPEVLYSEKRSPDRLHLRLDTIRWSTSTRALHLWKEGQTGFPLVDACMRQMNQTGYMHNRGRMLVAHVLIKLLLIDWREGERYFAQQLTDYDVASNNGNWAAILGRGVYNMPFFRVMNPWLQSAQYDSRGEFIRRWVPELTNVAPRDLHRWHQVCDLEQYKTIDYPAPIIDYYANKDRFVHLYKHTYLRR